MCIWGVGVASIWGEQVWKQGARRIFLEAARGLGKGEGIMSQESSGEDSRSESWGNNWQTRDVARILNGLFLKT